MTFGSKRLNLRGLADSVTFSLSLSLSEIVLRANLFRLVSNFSCGDGARSEIFLVLILEGLGKVSLRISFKGLAMVSAVSSSGCIVVSSDLLDLRDVPGLTLGLFFSGVFFVFSVASATLEAD